MSRVLRAAVWSSQSARLSTPAPPRASADVKALALAHDQRHAIGTGAIVSHMQIDAGKLGDAIPYLHQIWAGPTQLVISTIMLCSYLGVSGLAGVMIMVISMPLNMRLGKMMGKYTKLTMELRDKRVKFTNELLQAPRSPPYPPPFAFRTHPPPPFPSSRPHPSCTAPPSPLPPMAALVPPGDAAAPA